MTNEAGNRIRTPAPVVGLAGTRQHENQSTANAQLAVLATYLQCPLDTAAAQYVRQLPLALSATHLRLSSQRSRASCAVRAGGGLFLCWFTSRGTTSMHSGQTHSEKPQ